MTANAKRLRVFVLGATGTIGQASVRSLVTAGHEVVCFVRPGSSAKQIQGTEVRFGDVTDVSDLEANGLKGERFDAIVSCLASRSGTPQDAWAIDHDAHVHALPAFQRAGISHIVLLSALCVQRPKLAFQQAKLAAERAIMTSEMTYSIVRPTAFFKSLSGQIERVRQGKAFLVFGDGTLTACKPISDGDLGSYIAECVTCEKRRNRVLPIGGPGEAITPLDQANALFALLDQEAKLRRVPVALLDAIIAVTGFLGRFSSRLKDKAELARIGRYYATESMLVYDPVTQCYNAGATPSTGKETLFHYYEQVLAGTQKVELGDHAVFDRSKI